jgi:hypothetical protein
MLKGSKHFTLLLSFILMASLCALGQNNGENPNLFHLHNFRQVKPNIPTNKRHPKTRIDFGLVFGFFNNDPHYTNTTQSTGGYNIGIKEEFPVEHKSSLLLGFDFYHSGLSFNSYYFAPGYSFLYTPSEEIFNHSVAIDEMHFPIEYKFSFAPESKNVRTFYGMIGWVYRLLIYDNALVTNTQNGDFIFEGQDNLTYKYSLFTKTGSSIIEFGFGYQRNGLSNGNAFFIELTYSYGISPLIYSGNNMGSNDVTFTLNTLVVKVGIKL